MASTRTKRLLRYWLPGLLIAPIAGVALALAVLPWKPWLETKLTGALRAQGLNEFSFHIDRLGWSGLTLKEINFGEKLPLDFENITLGYSLSDLRTRTIRNATVNHITYTLRDAGNLRINIDTTTINAAQQRDKTWSGTWKMEGITLKDAPMVLPPLAGNGTFSMKGSLLKVDGFVASRDAQYRADFALTYNKQANSQLNLSAVKMPWNGGMLSLRNVAIPIGAKRAITFPLVVSKVSMEQLMESLTGDKAKGTGTVSGTIPVTLQADGSLRFGSGNLKADAPGTIALSPEVIPGDNPQVGLVRDILKNLHYSLLSMRIENAENNKLIVFLTVEGMNPEVSGARPVRLNVQLRGDLIQLVTSSILTLTDPKTLLKQEPK